MGSFLFKEVRRKDESSVPSESREFRSNLPHPDPFLWTVPDEFDPSQSGPDGLMRAPVFMAIYKASNPFVQQSIYVGESKSESPRVRKFYDECREMTSWSVIVDICGVSGDPVENSIVCGLELSVEGSPAMFRGVETKMHHDIADIIQVGHISNIARHSPHVWVAELKKSGFELFESLTSTESESNGINRRFVVSLLKMWGLEIPSEMKSGDSVLSIDRNLLRTSVQNSPAEIELLNLDFSPLSSDDSISSHSSQSKGSAHN